MYRDIPLDTVYMIAFALFLTPLINNHQLLASFGFKQESYIMSIYAASLVWNTAIDWPMQLWYLYLSRQDETDADLYAVDRGHGYALRTALIRNFGQNLDNIYCTKLHTLITMSHPTCLQRIADIDKGLRKRDLKKYKDFLADEIEV